MVTVVVTVAAVTTRPAHTVLCSSRVSSWHRHCQGNLSLGHWHWLCPVPIMEPLGCFLYSMLEEFGLPWLRSRSLLCPGGSSEPWEGEWWSLGCRESLVPLAPYPIPTEPPLDLWWVGCGASITVASRQDGMGMALWDSAS